MKQVVIAVVLVFALAQAGPALASSSAWHNAEGGRIRLVTTGKPDGKGIVRGALEIDLKPGWKTYWLDPGDAGVPPSIDISASANIASAEISFPAPRRFDDGFAKWAGYDEPVSFPVSFVLSDPNQAATIDAKVFLGICETICIPVQATLAVDPASDAENAADATVVRAAFEALPGGARPDFGVTLVPGDKDEVTVEATFSGEPATVDFFLAGSDGYQFGPPERHEKGGRLFFSVPILQRPDNAPHAGGLHYTLVGAAASVSGTLPFPPAP
jgi:DsbC/DsbD-like thiol-disulfide interchange protein